MRTWTLVVAAAVMAASAPTQAQESADAGALSVPFQPILVAQPQYAAHSNEAEGENGFELQRLRLGLRARPAEWFYAVGEVEYDGGETELKVFEAYLEAVAGRSWHFSLGFRRTPLFHTAKDLYVETLAVPELSLPVRALWPGIDLGADVHYSAESLPVEAWVRVGDGSQNVGGNDDEHLAYDARVDWVAGSARPGHTGRVGARIGAGGHIKYREFGDGITDTTPDGFVFFHPVPTFGWQAIGEAHAALWCGPVTATLEGGYAREERSKIEAGALTGQRIPEAPIISEGAALDVAWMIWGTERSPAKWWPGDASFDPSTWRGGSLEVGVRIERMDLEADAPDVKPGGAEGGALAVDWWATSFASLSLAAYADHYFASPIEESTETSTWLVLARATVSFE